jgi:dihydroorotate dehydrogenase (fumarate)
MIEVNLSCPSIDENEILYEDLELTGKILERVEKQVGEKRYTIKLGYMLPSHLNKTISLISSYNPFGIVAINSIPGMFVEKETSYFGSKYGGISGKMIQPFALYTVSKIRERLNRENREDISVIGCGGISTSEDCFKFLKAGAEYLQVGTEFMAKRNKELFTRLLIELCAKGFTI